MTEINKLKEIKIFWVIPYRFKIISVPSNLIKIQDRLNHKKSRDDKNFIKK